MSVKVVEITFLTSLFHYMTTVFELMFTGNDNQLNP